MNNNIKLSQQFINSLSGVQASQDDVDLLTNKLGEMILPSWFVKLITDFKLIGSDLFLSEQYDESEMGVMLKWKTPQDMIDELFEYYPGVAVVGMGYLPVGSCLEGSGDPYFVKLTQKVSDAKFVRIRHDLVEDDDTYLEDEIETVCLNIQQFFNNCQVK